MLATLKKELWPGLVSAAQIFKTLTKAYAACSDDVMTLGKDAVTAS